MYQETVEYYRNRYGITFPVPSFENWMQQHQQHYATQQHQQNIDFATQNNFDEISASAQQRERWLNVETKALVSAWKNLQDKLESYQSPACWNEIRNAVNKCGRKRTVDQCKQKIKRLKDEYKKAKDNNKKTGAAPVFSEFYDVFDEIMGEKDIVSLPNLLETGCKTNCDTKSEERKLRKRKSNSRADEYFDKTLKLMGDAEKRQQDFLKDIIKQQNEQDEKERQRDREFMMDMMKLLKKD